MAPSIPCKVFSAGGKSVEARIKVPVGSEPLAGSQELCLPGFCAFPISVPPLPQGDVCFPPVRQQWKRASQCPPQCRAPGRRSRSPPRCMLFSASPTEPCTAKTRKENAVFPTAISYRTEGESSSFLPSSHMGESTESNDSHQTISFLIIIIIITSIYRAVCVRHRAKHFTAWVTACRLSKGLRKQKLLFYR